MVLYHMTMSLDGFVTGPGDAMDWIFAGGEPEPNQEAEEVIRTTGAALAGRRSYDVGVRSGQRLYGGAWTGPVFVLTHEPPDVPPEDGLTFVTGDVRAAVARAELAADGANVVLIGADVARQCLEAGLVDEILVHVVPVLLGDGLPLYRSSPGGRHIDLEPARVSQAGRVTNLRYRVRNEPD